MTSGLRVDRDVLLIVPTHDHASTLDLAVRSALEQTFADLDVLVIGDGVGDDTRDVVDALCRADERVRFLDRPKSPSRAEEARHEVITASTAKIVTYLGDDDLLLPDHVETVQELLGDADFAHPFPIVIEDGDRLRALPTDLGDARCVAWHLHPAHNTVSLTGAAHTTDAYRRLPNGWQAPPPGRWSDHFMWEQFLRLPGLRAVTGARATTIKPPSTLRRDVDPEDRRAALASWWDRMHEPDFRSWWDSEVVAAVRRSAVETFMDRAVLDERRQDVEFALARLRDDMAHAIEDLEARHTVLRTEAVAVRAHLDLIRSTRTWTLHDRLAGHRLLRRLLARGPRRDVLLGQPGGPPEET